MHNRNLQFPKRDSEATSAGRSEAAFLPERPVKRSKRVAKMGLVEDEKTWKAESAY